MTKFYAKYLALFIGLGAYNTFLPVYLENTLGFTSSQVGMVVSIPSILGIIFVPIWGLLSDISKKTKDSALDKYINVSYTCRSIHYNKIIYPSTYSSYIL